MNATPREIVHQTLDFAGPPRAARDLWVLPIAAEQYPDELAALERDFPSDFTAISGHEREIAKFLGAVERKGMTLVPLSVYFNSRGRAKVELALAKGKKAHDKRESIKERDWKRDKQRLLKDRG